MIYESCVLLRPEAKPEDLEKIQKIFNEVVAAGKGELLKVDDWGMKSLAQPTSKGIDRGHYLYFMYQLSPEHNAEIQRRLNIQESLLKYLLITVGTDTQKDACVKNYVNPFKPQEIENNDDDDGREIEQDRRAFARRRSCWFEANKIKADWKNPNTYRWLVNEFGKISPARVSGVSSKHQKFATQAIKRARNIGLVGIMNDDFAR